MKIYFIIFSILFIQSHLLLAKPSNRTYGPALRPYNIGTAKSDKLKTRINGNILLGQEVTLTVTLPRGYDVIKSCQWTSPNGEVNHVGISRSKKNRSRKFCLFLFLGILKLA